MSESRRLGSRVRSRELLVGTVISLPDLALTELAAAPFDFVWLDLEHGALSLSDMQALAIASRAAGCASLVRLPRSDSDCLPAALDAGVDGIVAPRIDCAVEAERLVARLRYPPAGSRGFGPRRAGSYGRASRFWDSPEADVVCFLQIESAEAVDAIDAIVAVEGVDAVVVGCADLSFALGAPGDLRSPQLRAAIDRVQVAADLAGVASGIAGSGSADELTELAGGRSSIVVYSVDTRIYAAAMDAAARQLTRGMQHHAG